MNSERYTQLYTGVYGKLCTQVIHQGSVIQVCIKSTFSVRTYIPSFSYTCTREFEGVRIAIDYPAPGRNYLAVMKVCNNSLNSSEVLHWLVVWSCDDSTPDM